MKKTGIIWISLIAATITIAGCKKSEEFINPVYQCECGKVSWFGDQHELLMAEYLQPAEDNAFGRRYYITADIASEGESEPHHLNMIIETDSVHHQYFDILLSQHIDVWIQEVNYNDPNVQIREFVPVLGNVNISPAFFGGTEKASFTLSVQESFNGSPAGAILPLSGNLEVGI
ncbi:MAG: hypothetical protein KDC12_00785 [Flavobacteriales bacterium]|nr:hypothetical protein [Flavobacteriales bacterium]